MEPDRYRMAENPAATQSASGLASVGYKSFLSEVNNLNNVWVTCVTSMVKLAHGHVS